jgi:hypothetical protein
MQSLEIAEGTSCENSGSYFGYF